MGQRRVSLAKLTPPHLPQVVERTRLYRVLDRARRRPVVWISGPPGAGKTTLVASYLKARRLPVLWYRLDENDADPSSFFHYLSVAAKTLAPRFRKPLPVLTPEYVLGLPTFTRRFFQELSARLPRRCLLVLDNYQEVPSTSGLHHLLPYAAQELPEHMSLIVMSRQDPPAAMVKLEAERAMALVGPEQVVLSKAEAAAIIHLHARRGGDRSAKAFVEGVYRQVGGWAAGIVLTLEHEKRSNVSLPDRVRDAPEAVFQYLAGEVMERLSPEVQDLLLRTSVLPDISVSMAERLTNLSTAGETLASLHRARYFTECRQGRELMYQYHPLFREFLQQRARHTFPATDMSALRKTAAEALVTAGRIEDAVMLLQTANDWNSLAQVILGQAASLIAQGRIQTLETWIRSMPEGVRREIPWLTFWLAMTRVSFTPDEAYGLFEQVFAQFRSQGDQVGVLLSWCGAIRAVLIRWTDLGRLNKWIELFPHIHPEGTPYPSIEVEAHVADSMAGAIMQGHPDRPDARVWLDRAVRLAEHLPLTVQTGSRYMIEIYYLWIGDFVPARAGLAQFSTLVNVQRGNPVTKIFFHATAATLAWFDSDVDLCRLHVRKARDLVNESGLHVWDGLLLSQGVAGELIAGNLVAAEVLLKEEDAATVRLGGIHRAHFLHLSAWFKLLRGDLQQAWEDVQRSNSMIVAEGGLMFGEAMDGIVAAHILLELGQGAEAGRWIERVKHIGERMQSDLIRFGVWLLTAQLALDRGDESAGLDALRKGLVIGEARGLMQYPGIHRKSTVQLCAKALEAGIMVPFVQRMIQKHRFTAPPQAGEIEAWPWPVRISTLGRFAVLIDGQPLATKRKSPHRLFDLLKAIIAWGGEEVSITQLMDALWPEVDGDTARENFDKSLQRLRHLLGHEQLIVMKAGKVSLNRELCWVDALAFEDMAKEIDRIGTKGDAERAAHLAQRANALYRGPFLGEEDRVIWFDSRRDRVRTRCAQMVGLLCDRWMAKGLPENAVACLKSVIAADRDMAPLVLAQMERLHGHAKDQAQPPMLR